MRFQFLVLCLMLLNEWMKRGCIWTERLQSIFDGSHPFPASISKGVHFREHFRKPPFLDVEVSFFHRLVEPV